jgi:hypothetical protein
MAGTKPAARGPAPVSGSLARAYTNARRLSRQPHYCVLSALHSLPSCRGAPKREAGNQVAAARAATLACHSASPNATAMPLSRWP